MSTTGILEKEKEVTVNVNTPEYLAQLLKDKKALSGLPLNLFAHVERLLEEEISRVRGTLFPVCSVIDKLPDPMGPIVQISEKLYVPVKEYPDYNFVGRILGPRGKTAQELERLTGCKIMVRGRGSMRDRKREEQNIGRPNWDHLKEELHVLITVEDSKERADIKLARAVSEIKRLLVPAAEGEDNLKKGQLMELAILRGTFRENSANNNLPNLKAFFMGNSSLPDVPTTMVPTAATCLPQALRSPTPAVHPHLIGASQLLPRMANGQTLLANGLPHQALIPTHEGALAYPHYETYPYAMAPALLEYPVEATATVGAVPKARRFVRDHPYQRAVLERAAATGN
ncbi:KH domain-containing RNA-binding protein qki.S-like isoform X2 [Glandiceps talaboti]